MKHKYFWEKTTLITILLFTLNFSFLSSCQTPINKTTNNLAIVETELSKISLPHVINTKPSTNFRVKAIDRNMLLTTGFYKPIANYPEQGGYIGWLGTNSYHPGQSHVGVDFKSNVGDAVYSIGSGTIMNKGTSVGDYGGEGISGGGIIIRYRTRANVIFYVTYAHIQSLTSKNIGDTVSTGDELGRIGNYYVTRNGKVKNWPHLHLSVNIQEISWAGYSTDTTNWRNPVDFLNTYYAGIPRGEAISLILNRLEIKANQSSFNSSIFGKLIPVPSDVIFFTSYRNAIVTAYNKGILDSSLFRPNDILNRAELCNIIAKALPLSNYSEFFKSLPFSDIPNDSVWWKNYLQRVYSAEILPNYITNDEKFQPNKEIIQIEIDETLNKAYNFLKGPNSGINIYLSWIESYVDLDLYLLDSTVIVEHNNYIVSNLSSIRGNVGTVYWARPESIWGAQLDYDSWGGNQQPQHSISEERITVDPRKVKRPGRYLVLINYYNGWENSNSPDIATFKWWGFYAGKNINSNGGNPFEESIRKGETKLVGWLDTQ